MQRFLSVAIAGIGGANCSFTVTPAGNQPPSSSSLNASSSQEAIAFLITWLEKNIDFTQVGAIGHRIVHGLDQTQAVLIDELLLQKLKTILVYDPDHLPGEIGLVELFRKHYPNLPQVACFDTAFHATLPRVARILPLPRRFDRAGIHRYGFHGLSYESLLENLMGIADPGLVRGRLILAHLGGGASITAVRNLRSVDTSMGFTPTGGLMMGTRSGDLDPGALSYLMQHEELSPAAINDLINHESGLIGVSETSSDMQELLKKESTDERAAEAVALFGYQVKKYIGSYTAALSGLDLLAFTGGIGENAAPIRSRICAGLGYLGIELDEERNQRNDVLISAGSGRVPVYVIPADEEKIIAKRTASLLRNSKTDR